MSQNPTSSTGDSQGDNPVTGREARPFLGITFQCCRVYWRIYMTHDRKRFAGHCPKCGTPVSVPIGPGGSQDRFFRVS